MGVEDSWATLPIINAAGYGTRVGGSCPVPEVLNAMRWAQEHYFEIDDLLAHASCVIARETGSEAGLVTCSASAALTLGASAILARSDIAVMDSLPDVSGLDRTEFLFPVPGYYDYDHPLRASGGKLVEFPFHGVDLEHRLADAVGERTAGVVYAWKNKEDTAIISRIAKVCQSAAVPFLLDAAMALPPAENLRHLALTGANLIALSGGKHLGGPQNSGLLFGDKELIQSAWLQMVDMDVRPESWSYLDTNPEGLLPFPPRHGVGRGFKVGKDVILGCVTALERYSQRDFAVEREAWNAACQKIARELKGDEVFKVSLLVENQTGQYPAVRLQCRTGERMAALKRALKSEFPKIILSEDEVHQDTAFIYPMCLQTAEIDLLIQRLNSTIHEIA